ncbi:hypothetical protein CS023_07715 [Shewanella xiamenensis]|nr:hypothetical protein CS023_07715 [Shewanella xiamenensis]
MDPEQWAQCQFGHANLNDPRRTQRLVSLATSIQQAPDMQWAYERLARLGGWKDTKRTGRACVEVLWEGWFRLQTILEGYELAMSLNHEDL